MDECPSVQVSVYNKLVINPRAFIKHFTSDTYRLFVLLQLDFEFYGLKKVQNYSEGKRAAPVSIGDFVSCRFWGVF